MKKILIVLLAIAILAAAGIALAGIGGTAHDLRIKKTNSTLEPCAFCHTPHQGSPGASPSYPLWNRSQATQTYTIYTSTTFNMYPGSATSSALDFGSAPCLVCHNGVTSDLINYPGRGSTANVAYNITSGDLTTWTNVGIDLRNEHPVSFVYSSGLDAQANNFPTAATGTIPGVSVNYPLFAQAVGASATYMGCSTCHAVHHTPVAAYNTVNQVYFLRSSNAGSALCDDCHRNKM